MRESKDIPEINKSGYLYQGNYTEDETKWMNTFTKYMYKNHNDLLRLTEQKKQIYQFENGYVGFSSDKNNFYFYTSDEERIEELQNKITDASFGRNKVRIPYTNRKAVNIICEYCDNIIEDR